MLSHSTDILLQSTLFTLFVRLVNIFLGSFSIMDLPQDCVLIPGSVQSFNTRFLCLCLYLIFQHCCFHCFRLKLITTFVYVLVVLFSCSKTSRLSFSAENLLLSENIWLFPLASCELCMTVIVTRVGTAEMVFRRR